MTNQEFTMRRDIIEDSIREMEQELIELKRTLSNLKNQFYEQGSQSVSE